MIREAGLEGVHRQTSSWVLLAVRASTLLEAVVQRELVAIGVEDDLTQLLELLPGSHKDLPEVALATAPELISAVVDVLLEERDRLLLVERPQRPTAALDRTLDATHRSVDLLFGGGEGLPLLLSRVETRLSVRVHKHHPLILHVSGTFRFVRGCTV